MLLTEYIRDEEVDVSIVGLADRGLSVTEIAELCFRSCETVREVLGELDTRSEWVPTPSEIQERAKAVRDRWSDRERRERGRDQLGQAF